MLKDNLIAARALIDTPEKWTKDSYAKTATGNHIGVFTDNATCFCALGALIRASGTPVAKFAMGDKGGQELRKQLPPPWEYVHCYNDDPATTHADILNLFDRAIASC